MTMPAETIREVTDHAVERCRDEMMPLLFLNLPDDGLSEEDLTNFVQTEIGYTEDVIIWAASDLIDDGSLLLKDGRYFLGESVLDYGDEDGSVNVGAEVLGPESVRYQPATVRWGISEECRSLHHPARGPDPP